MNLIKGDCIIELKKLPDKSIDFFYLDLPYGQTACKWDVKIDHKALWVELRRLAKSERTPFFFSCTTKFGFELFNTAPKGWFRWDLVWKKNRAAGFLNAYKLPMRKHEMIYCFAKKTPEYDVSSHKEYTEESKRKVGGKNEFECYGKKDIHINRAYPSRTHKNPLPTSDITPPSEEHELVYCFAKKTPEYDVSSHLTGVEKIRKPSINDKYLTEFQNKGSLPTYEKPHTSKVLSHPLPTSDITPPSEEHELVYCFAKKTPEYDVSSHLTGEEVTKPSCSNDIFLSEAVGHRESFQKPHTSKVLSHPLPASDITPSSWCEFKNDEGINHRTAKPVKLMEFLLKYWTKEGDTICDPTAGSGSMGVACKNMNRKFIGIEKDDEIYNLMCSRINN
jgi:hypothetical protein